MGERSGDNTALVGCQCGQARKVHERFCCHRLEGVPSRLVPHAPRLASRRYRDEPSWVLRLLSRLPFVRGLGKMGAV